ncbi:DUF3137 domain-containing protein [Shewanella corallii]|uniref:DUF3137 domain-containing protein n=1 Tax=Shewanella corallii TaxID=560080 RepID=A0ABT0N7U1_9GAMM|nr:DUF3137 domain-containing protein [Shewanella corallii]MCL2914508.1 DUF3137 domain-containing protein [Shewanella corallii]
MEGTQLNNKAANSYNAQVRRNIARIREAIELARDQDDLIRVINDVADHRGPLDYRDTWYRVLFGLSLSMVLSALLIFVWGSELWSWLDKSIYFYVFSLDLWYPAALLVTVGHLLEDRDIALPFPAVMWGRMLIWAAIGFVIPLNPNWFDFFWGTLIDSLASLLGTEDPVVGVLLLNLLPAVLMLFWLIKRSRWRAGLSDKIYLKDALLNNNLQSEAVYGKGMAGELSERFCEFRRGNEQQEIKALYKGHYEGSQYSFDYQLYTFHYVVKRKENRLGSGGRRTTQTVTIENNRYGILLQFPFARGICLSGDCDIKPAGEAYTGASNVFNRVFKVYALDPLAAARLLTPVLEEKLAMLGQHFLGPVVEIAIDGSLCVAVNKELLPVRRKFGLDRPEIFAKEIARHTELKELDLLLDTVHEMMRLSDNNFEGRSVGEKES